ncbi:MAG: hypothetical protein GF383_16455 [Candidatus Lokiarchaeota archaeon]|nr:hypothetical protein [Candidatus Lokiarchaeota archaeon]
MLDQSVKIRNTGGKKKRIAILSDTHISQTGGQFNQKVFDKGISLFNKIKDVTLFLHLGDLTQWGTLMDYEFAIDQMNKFDPVSKAPLEYIIGNHDALNVGYLLFEEIIGDRHFEFETDDLYIIGIDSTKPDLPGGIIHHNIINAMRKRLEAREDKIKIVCFHNQLLPIPNTGKERSAIDDSGNMLQMLIDTKADLVLNGHRHVSNLYSLSSPLKDLYIFNAGTFSCNKTRYRELFTYSVIDIINNNLTFKIFPILDADNNKKEIQRNIKTYYPRNTESNEQPKHKFIQICNSAITKESEKKGSSIHEIVDKINQFNNIDLVVHTGNLTRNSFEEEFLIARDLFKNLKFPFLCVPGYWDSKPPSWIYWDKYFGDLNPEFETDQIYFKGINSTTSDSKNGFIGRKRLNQFIEKVLNIGHQKFIGVCCHHSSIPTPMSVWRTELMDAGDALSQFARSHVNLILNSSPSITFNVKIENSIFSNGGNIMGEHFEKNIVEIDIFERRLIHIKEHNLDTKISKIVSKYIIYP